MTANTLDTTVEISLDGTGAYSGAYDDVTAAVDVAAGVTVDLGREGARALMPPKVPSHSVVLHNEDGAYSQENPASPVYQLLIPGRPSRVTVLHGERRQYRSHTQYRAHVPYRGQAPYTVATGAVDDLRQTTEPGRQRAEIDSLGTMAMLVRQQVTVAVQTNIRTDQAIGLVLDAAEWPADKRALSVGDTTLLYWWCDERSPWAAILELLAAEGPCQLYQDAEGVLHFENRNYRAVESRATTSQATLYDTDTGGLWFTGLAYEPGFKSIYNRATYSTKRRTLGSLAKIWEYGATITLSAGQSVTLIAKPQYPFQEAVAPQSGTDYTVSAGSLSGVSLSATSGLVSFLTLTAGGSGATVTGVTSTGIQIRAKALTVLSETIAQNSVDASASIAKYSPIPGANIPRTLAVQGWPEIDPVSAQAVCNAWVNRYMEQRPQVTIRLRNADVDHVRQMLEREVSDRVTLVDTNTGLNTDFWVEMKTLRISGAGGRTVECELGLEKCGELSGAVWDESEWDDVAATWGI